MVRDHCLLLVKSNFIQPLMNEGLKRAPPGRAYTQALYRLTSLDSIALLLTRRQGERNITSDHRKILLRLKLLSRNDQYCFTTDASFLTEEIATRVINQVQQQHGVHSQPIDCRAPAYFNNCHGRARKWSYLQNAVTEIEDLIGITTGQSNGLQCFQDVQGTIAHQQCFQTTHHVHPYLYPFPESR
jgi:hypothetical protein